MGKCDLKNVLIQTLAQMYDKESFSILTVFFQGEHPVLLFLSNNLKTEIYPSLISDKLQISRSRVTAILTVLRKKGYVTLEMSEKDRRRMLVRITADGLTFIREKQEWADRYFAVLVEDLGVANTEELIRLVKLCTDIMGRKSVENLGNRNK